MSTPSPSIIDLSLGQAQSITINASNFADGSLLNLSLLGSGTVYIDGVDVNLNELILDVSLGYQVQFVLTNGASLTSTAGLASVGLLQSASYRIEDTSSVLIDAALIDVGGGVSNLLSSIDVEFVGNGAASFTYYPAPVAVLGGLIDLDIDVTGMGSQDTITVGRPGSGTELIPDGNVFVPSYSNGQLHLTTNEGLIGGLLTQGVDVNIAMSQNQYVDYINNMDDALNGSTFTFPNAIAVDQPEYQFDIIPLEYINFFVQPKIGLSNTGTATSILTNGISSSYGWPTSNTFGATSYQTTFSLDPDAYNNIQTLRVNDTGTAKLGDLQNGSADSASHTGTQVLHSVVSDVSNSAYTPGMTLQDEYEITLYDGLTAYRLVAVSNASGQVIGYTFDGNWPPATATLTVSHASPNAAAVVSGSLVNNNQVLDGFGLQPVQPSPGNADAWYNTSTNITATGPDGSLVRDRTDTLLTNETVVNFNHIVTYPTTTGSGISTVTVNVSYTDIYGRPQTRDFIINNLPTDTTVNGVLVSSEISGTITIADLGITTGDNNDLIINSVTTNFKGNEPSLTQTNTTRFDFGPMFGGVTDDTLNGTDSDDYIVGGAGDDTINGGAGNDTIYGDFDPNYEREYNPILYPFGSDDVINGGAGDDTIHGGRGNDILNGDDGNDTLYGGDGNDTLNGGNGNDTLVADGGSDTLTGGAGADTFTIIDPEIGQAVVIKDFQFGAGGLGDAANLDVFNFVPTISPLMITTYNIANGTNFTNPLDLLNHNLNLNSPFKPAGTLDLIGLGIPGTVKFENWVPGNQFHPSQTTVPCFFAGTMIATPVGETPVEELKEGDIILTASGDAVEVMWLGTKRVFPAIMRQRDLPICISQGALGNGLPMQDLYLSADHGMIIDGMIINAGALVNGKTIRHVSAETLPPSFVYYHVETKRHDEILANGAVAETFIDYVGRSAFDNYSEYLDSYGAERIIPEMKRLRISSQMALPRQIAEQFGIDNSRVALEAELNDFERLLASA